MASPWLNHEQANSCCRADAQDCPGDGAFLYLARKRGRSSNWRLLRSVVNLGSFREQVAFGGLVHRLSCVNRVAARLPLFHKRQDTWALMLVRAQAIENVERRSRASRVVDLPLAAILDRRPGAVACGVHVLIAEQNIRESRQILKMVCEVLQRAISRLVTTVQIEVEGHGADDMYCFIEPDADANAGHHHRSGPLGSLSIAT
jgi:hypothetical protein